MATQTFSVAEMQAINTSVQQAVQNAQTGQKTATIIQPAHTGGQQFIVTTSAVANNQNDHNSDGINLQGGGQAVYPAHVQYVDQGSDSGLYSNNGQMTQNYSDYSPTMYTPVSGAYYNTSGNQLGTLSNVGLQGQVLHQIQGGTYLVQGGAMDGEGHPLTHTTRASPATVQWLIDNYETAEGVSLPRCTLYNHYLRHCQEQKLDPMNPASFGKLIRSVFLGLRTRRLGTRGNSKYHYYGIRIKPTSPLNQFTDDQTMAMRQQPINQGKRPASSVKYEENSSDSVASASAAHSDSVTTQQQQHQQFLGDASGAIPNFGDIDISGHPLPDGITQDNLRTFQKLYKDHCEAILDVVVNLQFSLIEALWQHFWRNPAQDQHDEFEAKLPKAKLFIMCKYEPIQKYVRRSDYQFYQALVEVLIPDVLRPIPSSLTQAIRNFAKSLENWLKGAMKGVPDEMVKTKIGAVVAFAQTLRRYTSLNHLAQAARAVLQNTSQINQMLTDLNRVDFVNVQEQASWVCQCEDTTVTQLEQDFKATLQQQNSLEQWAVWLESVVNQVLKPHEGSDNFPKAARQFLLKWSFYSSMVIRDLTLRSAASFGSFHLIRLLYDEYMFYLVEHKVAAATGETPIAVMGEVRQFIDLSSAITLGTLDSKPKAASVAKPTVPTSTATATLSLVNSSGTTNPTTVTVLTSGGTTHGAKTIVVVPVSSGSGDGQAAKRLKTDFSTHN